MDDEAVNIILREPGGISFRLARQGRPDVNRGRGGRGALRQPVWRDPDRIMNLFFSVVVWHG